MALFCFILSFLLFHAVELALAMDDINFQHPVCPAFECGRLGSIRFPFANDSLSKCGLYTLKNCNQSLEKRITIQLKSGGKWFDVDSISQANVIHIKDPELEQRIKSRDCSVLADLALPTSASSSLSTPDNLTLFTCSGDPKVGIPLNISSLSCPGYYISPPYQNTSSFHNCSKIYVPVRPVGPNNPSVQFTPDFQLQVTVHLACRECFYWRGGQCLSTRDGKFNCTENEQLKKENENDNVMLKLTLGIGIPFLLLSVLSFFVWYNRKRLSVLNFVARIITRRFRHPLASKSGLDGGNFSFQVPIFSYSELKGVTNIFHPDRELGHGGFGTVYYGKLHDGREVAIKRLYHQQRCKLAEQFVNEVEILSRLRHRNLVSLYGCSSRLSHELLLVYEFIPNGTVADHLHGKRANPSLLTWPIRMDIAIETATALAYLHASDIIHRDVKTTNILLDYNFSVKVADFGISRLLPNNASHVSTAPQGTLGYMDPQYFQFLQLTTKSDVYAFGVVLLELVSSKPVIDATRQSEEIGLIYFARNRIRNQELDQLFDPQLVCPSNSEVREMIEAMAQLAFECLRHDAEKRPSMEDVCKALKMIRSCDFEEKQRSEKDDLVLLRSFE